MRTKSSMLSSHSACPITTSPGGVYGTGSITRSNTHRPWPAQQHKHQTYRTYTCTQRHTCTQRSSTLAHRQNTHAHSNNSNTCTHEATRRTRALTHVHGVKTHDQQCTPNPLCFLSPLGPHLQLASHNARATSAAANNVSLPFSQQIVFISLQAFYHTQIKSDPTKYGRLWYALKTPKILTLREFCARFQLLSHCI